MGEAWCASIAAWSVQESMSRTVSSDQVFLLLYPGNLRNIVDDISVHVVPYEKRRLRIMQPAALQHLFRFGIGIAVAAKVPACIIGSYIA